MIHAGNWRKVFDPSEPDIEPDLESLEELAAGERDDTFADVAEAHGFDARNTPIDVLMAGPIGMQMDIADYMDSDQ